MHTHLIKIIASSLGLTAAAAVFAGPPSTFFATPRSSTTPAKAQSTAAPQAVDSIPPVYQVMRGAPKSLVAGLTYVDSAGHELSRNRVLALQKAAGATGAALAKSDRSSEANRGY